MSVCSEASLSRIHGGEERDRLRHPVYFNAEARWRRGPRTLSYLQGCRKSSFVLAISTEKYPVFNLVMSLQLITPQGHQPADTNGEKC